MKGLAMRPVIFASFALALGTASLSSYACTSRDEYNQNISQLQANYNGAVGAANKQYADKNIPNVVFVDLSARNSARRYNNTVVYALADYMKDSQHAYDNYVRTACLWW